MNCRFSILSITFLFLMIVLNASVLAQNKLKQKSAQKEEIIITEHPADDNAIFKITDSIGYRIDLESKYRSIQQGKISYLITDFKGKPIARKSIPVTIPALGSKQVEFNMPPQKTGFYKVNFMLNVTDDDDTVRRVFGVDTANIHSIHPRPADFDEFWANAKKELSTIAPNFKVTEMPSLSSGNDQVYLVEMKSLNNLTIRAWMSLPKDRKPGERLPVTLSLPGYGADMQPVKDVGQMAFIQLNVRGMGNSRDVINLKRDEFINYNVTDKNKYIFKGVLMDCVRTLDFICSRPDLDSTLVYTRGGSMGGYLSLALASIDNRVALLSADNPGYPDVRSLNDDEFPLNTMREYARVKKLNFESLLQTWDYFDLKNFVTRLKTPAVVGIGLLDNFIPPAAEMAMYNNIPGNKKLMIFPNLTHQVGPEMANFVGPWVYDTFHVYDRYMVFHKPDPVKAPEEDPNAEVINIAEHPLNKDAIFTSDAAITYNLDLKSNFKSTQTGKIGYRVTTPEGTLVAQHAIDVSIPPKSTKSVSFAIPLQTAGFYKMNFTINTDDYDDTMRRAFGVDTNKIRSIKHKPADFDAFWTAAKNELAQVEPNFRMTEKPELKHNNGDKVYLIEMQSLNNMTIRGYLSMPPGYKTGQKLPVSIYLPGFGAQAVPMRGTSSMAILSISVRGQPLSDDQLKPVREKYITTGIADKNKYILRGAIMDCVRAIDFICSRPEFDPTAIYAAGASMGGYFSLALTGIDSRIKIASANNPVFSNFRSLAVTSAHDFPMNEILGAAKKNNWKTDAILNNLDYFDLQYFAQNIKVKTVVGIGLLDNMAPPTNELYMFNNIPGNKKLFVFPNLAHDIGPEMGMYTGKWVYENLQVFERSVAFKKEEEIRKAAGKDSTSVDITAYPGNKEALFNINDTPIYDIDLKNNFFKKKTGMLHYKAYASDGVLVRSDSVALSLDPRSTKRVRIEVPPLKTGFYNINFAVNVDGYNDTLKKVFGVNIEGIKSDRGKPAGFDQFWVRTKKELAAIPPNFKMTERKDMEKDGEQVYLVEMQSLDNVTVRAWLSLPKDRRLKEKFPVYIQLPDYGNTIPPSHGASPFAMLTLDIRGNGNSRDEIHPDAQDYVTYKLEDKDKYIYRGAIMDCVRLLDFVYAHQDMFDISSVFVTGNGQGGYLTLCLAGLDQRVSLCEAENPDYTDLKAPGYTKKWPVNMFSDYAGAKNVKFETLMDNFEYFDLKNFVGNIKCKVIVGIGLLDPVSPPANQLMMYNNIKVSKRLIIYPDLTHDIAAQLWDFKTRWMMDNLGM